MSAESSPRPSPGARGYVSRLRSNSLSKSQDSHQACSGLHGASPPDVALAFTCTHTRRGGGGCLMEREKRLLCLSSRTQAALHKVIIGPPFGGLSQLMAKANEWYSFQKRLLGSLCFYYYCLNVFLNPFYLLNGGDLYLLGRHYAHAVSRPPVCVQKLLNSQLLYSTLNSPPSCTRYYLHADTSYMG